MKFDDMIDVALDKVRCTLIEKNAKYGDSVRQPISLFGCEISPQAAVVTRMADKIRRAQSTKFDDEDTLLDLVGYAVILLGMRETAKHDHAEATKMSTPIPAR